VLESRLQEKPKKSAKRRRRAREMLGAEMPDEDILPSWRIFRNWGGSTAFLGIVKARTKESAIRRAIEEFNITDPEHQKRLEVQLRD
jgi:hypothetical protein